MLLDSICMDQMVTTITTSDLNQEENTTTFKDLVSDVEDFTVMKNQEEEDQEELLSLFLVYKDQDYSLDQMKETLLTDLEKKEN